MAGIGFELKRIYGRKTLAANIWGTIYATMTTITPAIVSAVLLLLLKFLLDESGLTVLESRFFISFATYAFLVATLVAVIFAAPVSRYVADSIYLRREQDICPSAFGVLSLSTGISGVVMLVLCVGMYYSSVESSMLLLVSYYLLGVLLTDAFSMMTFASALKHYRSLTFGFISGMVLGIGVYFLCGEELGVDRVTAACMALTVCYFVVVLVLVFQCVRAFGAPRGKFFAFLSYFRQYPKLAIGSFAYTFGIYCPTIIYWVFAGMGEQVSIFRTTPTYDMALFLAVIVNMPSLVIFVVKVETSFYEKYTSYVSALNNGTLDLIEKERRAMTTTLRYQLFFVYEIQLIITVIAVCLISVFFPYLNAVPSMLEMFVILSLGVYVVFCMYFNVVVFYCFSDYGSACACSVTFLAFAALGAFCSVLLGGGSTPHPFSWAASSGGRCPFCCCAVEWRLSTAS